MTTTLLITAAAILVAGVTAQQFKCQEPNGFFPDPKQCDKYYECLDGIPEIKICPDGLAFEIKNPNHARCDLPFNVDCDGRTEFQEPVSTVQCPRKNGFFAHENQDICDKFYNCVDGKANELSCSAGLVYEEERGSCVWPQESSREECRNPKKEKLPDGFACPEEEVIGDNGRIIPHPVYANPNDCQRFYVCHNGIQPQEGSCPPGTVFNDVKLKCDEPANVKGCEDWFKDETRRK